MASVCLQSVCKSFRDSRGREVRAADKVSLEVPSGELLVLVGPSGCGKSTLLRLIAGLEVLEGGSIAINDRVIHDQPPADRDVAMVFQNYALFPHLTVYENMAFGLKLRKIPAREIKSRVQEAAELLKLQDLLERKPHALSGGQRQRVALGRAIARQPKVFLLDEPLSNLDAQLRGETRTELARLHRRLGATMILVTHDQTEAMTLGQRLCVMDAGKIVQIGSPLEVYQHSKTAFVAKFLGSPGMNQLKGIVHASGRELLIAAGGPERQRFELGSLLAARLAPLTGKEIIIGFRPEHVRLSAESPDMINWEAVVDLCEPLGHENLLHLSRNGIGFTVRTPATQTFPPGQTVTVSIPPEAVFLFDSANGEMLVEQTAAQTV
jgi:multiple sugar transport system ATP-binding protein